MKQPRKMTYAPLYFIDFKEGCEDLTNEQIGTYLRVLFEIYDNMGPIAFDERKLSKRLNCRPHKARLMVESLVQMGKLYLTREGWLGNHRAENEIVKFISISVQNQLNGSSPKRNRNSTGKIPNGNNDFEQRPLSDRLHILEERKESTSSLDVLALPLSEEALEEARQRSATSVADALKRREMRNRKGIRI